MGDDLNGPAVLAMRSAFVALAAFCAVSIPSFGRLLGLVGGVCCSALTIFFPPLMLLRVDSRLRSEGAGGIVGAPYKAALYLTVMFGLCHGPLRPGVLSFTPPNVLLIMRRRGR